MFGKNIERIAYEYLTVDVNQREPLKRALLKTPVKSTGLLVAFGAIVLKRFGMANLNTPYRKAPEHILKRAMIFQEKVVSDVANFAAIVGDEGILEVCDALTSPDIQIAIFAGFVLTYNSGYSFDILQKIDHSLHNLNSELSDRSKTLLASLIILIQAQENFGRATSLLLREAFRRGVEVKIIGNSIMAEALDYLLPYEISVQKQEQPSSTDDEWAANWTHHWNWVDPDNAPWNYDD